jgi:Domain of unknown function (DUF5615)
MPRKSATARKAIPFFTDQNVPDSVGDYLISAGHTLVRLRDAMPTDTKDPVIAVACSSSGHVLITHDTDFKTAARRLQLTQREYREGLHRVLMRCPEPVGAKRLALAMNIIELEWIRTTASQPLNIEIHEHSIRVLR